MNKNILIAIGSPKGNNGNTGSIAEYISKKIKEEKSECSSIYLNKGIKNNTINNIENADVIILTLPVYENSVPGLVMQWFENIYSNKNLLTNKHRKIIVISNSGFPETEANRGTIETCRLFASEMGFIWSGGFPVAPGTLIGGKSLADTGTTYKKLIDLIDLIVENIVNDTDIPEEAYHITEKPFMSPFIYRIAGKIIQKGPMKKIGKNKFYGRPLIM